MELFQLPPMSRLHKCTFKQLKLNIGAWFLVYFLRSFLKFHCRPSVVRGLKEWWAPHSAHTASEHLSDFFFD